MHLNTLESFVFEEEMLQKITQLIIEGKTDEELLAMGYFDEELIERAHFYSISLYF